MKVLKGLSIEQKVSMYNGYVLNSDLLDSLDCNYIHEFNEETINEQFEQLSPWEIIEICKSSNLKDGDYFQYDGISGIDILNEQDINELYNSITYNHESI